ncbi:MAG: hypothetical protein JW847_03135 [Candidatus Omnitrophica bacterium]|nr:hypothetical protein [Candidatus Omnitrophota bacterium]
MGPRKYLSLVLVFIIGCTTSLAENVKSISKRYEEVVAEDGISQEEAKTIAQKQLIKENVVDLYELSKPQILDDIADLPNHQDYWFIFFKEKRPSSIPFIFMVLIHQETGKIKFADDYNEEKKWILEAALLR